MQKIKKNLPQRRKDAKYVVKLSFGTLRLCGGTKNVFYFLCLLGLISFHGCSRDAEIVSKEIISPDSMVAIMVDVHLAEAVGNMNRINDAQRFSAGELYPLIFKTHHIDSATFRKSFDYYLEHPKKFDKIYEQVIAELSKRESETNGK